MSNKTDVPAVGQYRPYPTKFMESIRSPHIDPQHLAENKATSLKLDLTMQSNMICNHVERALTRGSPKRKRATLRMSTGFTDMKRKGKHNRGDDVDGIGMDVRLNGLNLAASINASCKNSTHT